ncbi:hypothetical protein JYU29_08770 [Tianweitania sp. BSSL-BM11]|uniref:Tat pathway signal sequence domain protein n=1 Tax=Tianweitania aestuarii TaxID=2814886 RepID=A0ABS5RYM9_9HYPH|nr:hypothetical protein [Tianweitania aestuarii]MBS9720777.1 hypothetical protein [Tianweitania aestuarii]
MRVGTIIAAATTSTLMMLACVNSGWAQTAPSFSLELNGLEKSDNGCRLTFVVNNGFANTLNRAAFEIAMFNSQGAVDRLTVLEFKELPASKTKVTRFNLAGADCAQIGRILVNEVTDCTGEGINTATCRAALKTKSRAGAVQFGL